MFRENSTTSAKFPLNVVSLLTPARSNALPRAFISVGGDGLVSPVSLLSD